VRYTGGVSYLRRLVHGTRTAHAQSNRTMSMRRALFLCVAVVLALAGMVRAAETSNTSATLLLNLSVARPGDTVLAGVLLESAPGWHTYWRNPGDSGMAPKIAWELPEGFTAGPLQWPSPQRYDEPPLTSFGYDHAVLLYRTINPPENLAAGTTATFQVKASWLVCRDVCLPQTDRAQITLPVRPDPPAKAAANEALFAQAQRAVPVADPAWKFQVFVDRTTIQLSAYPPQNVPPSVVARSFFFPAQPNLVSYEAPAWSVADGAGRLTLKRMAGGPPLPRHLEGVLVLPADAPGGAQALEVTAPLTDAENANKY